MATLRTNSDTSFANTPANINRGDAGEHLGTDPETPAYRAALAAGINVSPTPPDVSTLTTPTTSPNDPVWQTLLNALQSDDSGGASPSFVQTGPAPRAFPVLPFLILAGLAFAGWLTWRHFHPAKKEAPRGD